jgi:hypothetical protein
MESTKPKGERLKETITLLKKLAEVGVPTSSYVYEQVKGQMTVWVSDGPAYSERFDFGSHWGDLSLPVKPGKVSSLNLVAKRK